jgi:universal stress protein E
MKKLMVVVDDFENSQGLLDKALRWQPNHLTILLIDPPANENEKIRDQAIKLAEARVSHPVAIETATIQTGSVDKQADAISRRLIDYKADLLLLRKPKAVDESEHLSFVKKLLRNSGKTKLLFCRAKKWKAHPDVMCTIDIGDDSAEQKALNEVVYDVAVNTVSPALSAKLHLGSVIAISRVSEELDVVQPSEVLTKKGSRVREKVAEFEQAHGNSDAIIHVTAGVPYKEIVSLAKKQKIDLVVIGNVGRKGLLGFVIGNTAEKILQNLSSDVLIVNGLY